jgi:amino acid adenylation domain-containing protein
MSNEQPNSPVSNTAQDGVMATLYRACEKFADDTAIESSDRRVSYRELDQQANRVASCLRANSLHKGSIVAVILADRMQIVTALIGILRAGCVFVPLEPDGPEARLRQMIENLSPDGFIVDCALAQSAGGTKGIFGYPAAGAKVFTFGSAPDAGTETNIDSYSIEKPSVAHGPDDACYIYHTSGSTGVPKGIVGRLTSLSHFIKWELDTFGISPGIRVSQLISPTFDPFLRDVLVPLCVGGTICIPPERSTVLDANLLIEWLDDRQINLIHCVPFLFNALVQQNPDANRFASLKYVLMSGEAVQVSDISKWMDIFGERVTLVNFYGATESTMIKFYHVIERADLQRGFIPIGKPMMGARAVVLDKEGNVCAPGVVGELYIRTPYLTLGYYKNPQLTKEVFVKNPLTGDAGDIVYKSGDFARVLSDGNFQFMGRSDGLVKIRGNRVEIGEIENTLQKHPQIKKAVVTFAEDVPGGRLIAFIVPERSAMLDTGEMRRFLTQGLPDYMMPSAFVQLDQLPLTPNGKVDRRALLPPDISQELEKRFVAPSNSTEEILARVWAEVLGVPQVGVFDNFFELGGHSLKATQVMSRISAVFQIDLPLRLLFEAGNVATLATMVEERLIEELEALPDDEARLSDALGSQ